MTPQPPLRPKSRLSAIPYVLVLLVLLWELTGILLLNDGRFCYSLDDAYTSLSLSENLVQLHYGVNPGEVSAPASSILWPFLLAPAAGFSFHEYLPLVLNCLFILLSVRLFLSMLDRNTASRGPRYHAYRCGLTVIFVLSMNLVGLVFIGMEHSLHVLLTLAVVVGLVTFVEERRFPWWCGVAIVLSPLVRYEGMALSIAAPMVLFSLGRRRLAAGLCLAWVLPITIFALVLWGFGLDPLPSSVVAKSSIAQAATGTLTTHTLWQGFYGALRAVVVVREASLVVLYGLIMLTAILYDRRRGDAPILLVGCVMVLAHALAGSYGSFSRYEIYVLAAGSVILIYRFRAGLQNLLERLHPLLGLPLLSLMAAVIFGSYFRSTISTPVGSNNVYQQQLQMHRFAVDHYADKVAVNDLGRVSYRNPNHVLDLWGLGSSTALRARLRNDPEWVSQIVEGRDVGLVMIYDTLFEGRIPDGWTRVARLTLGRKRVSVFAGSVSFYVTKKELMDDVVAKLRRFHKSIPKDVQLEILP